MRKLEGVRSMNGLGRCVDDSFKMVTIGVDDEGSIVVLAIVRARAWCAIVAAAIAQRGFVKEMNGLTRGRRKG